MHNNWFISVIDTLQFNWLLEISRHIECGWRDETLSIDALIAVVVKHRQIARKCR